MPSHDLCRQYCNQVNLQDIHCMVLRSFHRLCRLVLMGTFLRYSFRCSRFVLCFRTRRIGRSSKVLMGRQSCSFRCNLLSRCLRTGCDCMQSRYFLEDLELLLNNFHRTARFLIRRIGFYCTLVLGLERIMACQGRCLLCSRLRK